MVHFLWVHLSPAHGQGSRRGPCFWFAPTDFLNFDRFSSFFSSSHVFHRSASLPVAHICGQQGWIPSRISRYSGLFSSFSTLTPQQYHPFTNCKQEISIFFLIVWHKKCFTVCSCVYVKETERKTGSDLALRPSYPGPLFKWLNGVGDWRPQSRPKLHPFRP